MPPPKDIDFYENPFGYELRRHRERLGMTQVQLSERLGYSDDTISKVETGQAPPSEVFARDCDTMFGTHGAMESLAKLVRSWAGLPSWLREWLEAEQKAHTLQSWEPLLAPGLLQTEEYARALLREQPGVTDERIEELVATRMERQKILDRDDPPLLWIVVEEGVLHREIGEAEVMRGQLQALIDASRRPNITIQVVPSSTGAHPGLDGAFAIASFDGSPDLVYLDSVGEGQVSDRPADVRLVTAAYNALRSKALPARESVDLITRVMEKWT